jgi:antitoxin (DNA-binding transcriptional repressor) of toxin-antitoxin stability system
MDTEISKSRFKAHALEIFRQIEKTGSPVVITDNGTPALTVAKYRPESRSALDRLKGSVLRFDRPLDPVDESWDAGA